MLFLLLLVLLIISASYYFLFINKIYKISLSFPFLSLGFSFLYLGVFSTCDRWTFLGLFILIWCINFWFWLSCSHRSSTERALLGGLVRRFALFFFPQRLHGREIQILLFGFIYLYLFLSALFTAEWSIPSAKTISKH